MQLSDDLDDAAQISMSGVVFPIKGMYGAVPGSVRRSARSSNTHYVLSDTKPPVSEATDGVFAMDNGVSDYAKVCAELHAACRLYV